MKIYEVDKNSKQFESKSTKFSSTPALIFGKSQYILLFINFILIIYLLIQNNKLQIIHKNISSNIYNTKSKDNKIDKDMIRLKYPEINF